MISAGPFPAPVVAVALAFLLAVIVALGQRRHASQDRRTAAVGLLFDALLVGLFAARAAYVLRWWREYAASPLSIAAIGDGGFIWWVGLPIALIFLWWRAGRRWPARRRTMVAALTGTLAWLIVQVFALLAQSAAPPLPDLVLETADGRLAPLHDYLGRPTLVNLWATWCPPCRREMPILAAAQGDYPAVNIVLVNHGESEATVDNFLKREQLSFGHLLLDPFKKTAFALDTRVLPTTLLFGPDGRLVDSHMGELSAARLHEMLRRHLD